MGKIIYDDRVTSTINQYVPSYDRVTPDRF